MLEWDLWGRRNKKMHEAQNTSPKAAFEQTLALLSIFLDCSRVPKHQLCSVGCQQLLGKGSFKLNIDGAIFANLQVNGMGAIMCDRKGEMLLVVSSIKEKVFQDLKTVECLAILRGLQLYLNLRIACLTIESNCQLIVNQLQSLNCSSSIFGNILLNIRGLMSLFSSCNIQFASKNCNQASHKLAHFAWNVEHILPWYDNCPEFLSQAVWFDKTRYNVSQFVV